MSDCYNEIWMYPIQFFLNTAGTGCSQISVGVSSRNRKYPVVIFGALQHFGRYRNRRAKYGRISRQSELLYNESSKTSKRETNSSAIAERPRCRVGHYGQEWKTGTGRQQFTDIIGQFSTTVT